MTAAPAVVCRDLSLWYGNFQALDKVSLDPRAIDDTIGVLLKYQDDIAKIRGSEAARLLDEVKAEIAAAR